MNGETTETVGGTADIAAVAHPIGRRELLIRGAQLAGSLGAVGTLAACSNDSESGSRTVGMDASKSKGGGQEVPEMTWVINADAGSLDYVFSYDFATLVVVPSMVESLLIYDGAGQLKPNLAESWDLTDPETLVITLRPNVKFHDGGTMTAEDVAFSLNRHLDKELGSYLATFYDRVAEVAATGPLEVTVRLTEADSQFPFALATTAGAVSSKRFLERNGKRVGSPSVGIVGTGPYRFSSWRKGQEIVLERFDEYWNRARPRRVKRFVARLIEDEATIVAALRSGDVDGVFGTSLSGRAVRSLASTKQLGIYRSPSYAAQSIVLNTAREPFDDVRVRQALAHAIDREGILKSTWGGLGSVALRSLVTPAMWTYARDVFRDGFEKLPTFARDIDRAKQLIGEAGATGAQADMWATNPWEVQQAAAIQQAGKEIGLDLSPRRVDIGEYQAAFVYDAEKEGHPYTSILAQSASDFPDPAGSLVPQYASSSALNPSSYKNDRVDELLMGQRSEPDATRRAQMLVEAQAIVVREQLIIPLFSPDTLMVTNKRLGGYQLRPLWYWDPFVADFSGNRSA